KFTLPDLSEKKRPVAGHDRQKIKTFHGVIFHDATEMISVSWLFDLTRVYKTEIYDILKQLFLFFKKRGDEMSDKDFYKLPNDLDQPPKDLFIFCCPFCGHEKYRRVSLSERFGGPLSETVYKCEGCTVMFADPEKFVAIKMKKKRCCGCQEKK
ncbi:MAG: hypothetical protein ABH919_02835, partial [bacterium]